MIHIKSWVKRELFKQNIYFRPCQWSYWRESRVFGSNGSTIFKRLLISSFCKKYQDSHRNCNKNSGCDWYTYDTGHAERQSYKICIKDKNKIQGGFMNTISRSGF